MNFALNEHLGSGGPIKEQKAISADCASSAVKTRQHQQNKGGQQKFLSVKAFAGLLMVRMTKLDIKLAVEETYFLINYLVSFE